MIGALHTYIGSFNPPKSYELDVNRLNFIDVKTKAHILLTRLVLLCSWYNIALQQVKLLRERTYILGQWDIFARSQWKTDWGCQVPYEGHEGEAWWGHSFQWRADSKAGSTRWLALQPLHCVSLCWSQNCFPQVTVDQELRHAEKYLSFGLRWLYFQSPWANSLNSTAFSSGYLLTGPDIGSTTA